MPYSVPALFYYWYLSVYSEVECGIESCDSVVACPCRVVQPDILSVGSPPGDCARIRTVIADVVRCAVIGGQCRIEIVEKHAVVERTW